MRHCVMRRHAALPVISRPNWLHSSISGCFRWSPSWFNVRQVRRIFTVWHSTLSNRKQVIWEKVNDSNTHLYQELSFTTMRRHISTSGTIQIIAKLARLAPVEKFITSKPTKDYVKCAFLFRNTHPHSEPIWQNTIDAGFVRYQK